MESETQSNSLFTIVFFSMDAVGHINSQIGLADVLRKRGHRTIFLTTYPLGLADDLSRRGHEAHYCSVTSGDGQTMTDEEKMRSIMEPLGKLFRQGPLKTFGHTYGKDGALWKQLDDLVENHSKIEAKLKLLDPHFVIVDHIVGVPCIQKVCPKWARFYSGFPSVLYNAINDNFVAGFGLKYEEMSQEMQKKCIDIKSQVRMRLSAFFNQNSVEDWPSKIDMSPMSPYLNFYLGPEELGLEKLDNIKPLSKKVWHRCEHLVREEEGTFELPEKLKNKPGKLIYFSLGTLVTADVELIKRLIEILRLSPNRFIISKGILHNEYSLPDNMWGEKSLPQTLILPKVDLFITHGGHNSIIESFYFGVPGLIAMPVFADQFDSSQRIQDMGFGLRLNPFECTEEQLLNSIESLLNNSELRDRMKSIGERLRSTPCAEMAADRIERLLNSDE